MTQNVNAEASQTPTTPQFVSRTGRNLVVTIGRQYGSGGREVGEYLARKLGIAYYDKELVLKAAEKSGFSMEAFTKQNEELPRGLAWLFSYSSKGVVSNAGIPLDDQLFIAQARAIKEIALAESCVIVGRCADYVLEDGEGRVIKQHARRHNFVVDGVLYQQRYVRLTEVLQGDEIHHGRLLEADTWCLSAEAIWRRGLEILKRDPLAFVEPKKLEN